MAQLLVRNLPDHVKDGLARSARRHQRSLEAEAREILTRAATRDPVLAWLDDAEALREEECAVDLPAVRRSAPRPVEPADRP
jgi:plasmid stability protein